MTRVWGRGVLGAAVLGTFGACTCAQLPKDVVFCGPDGGDCTDAGAGDAGPTPDAGPGGPDGGSDAGPLPDAGGIDAGPDAGSCAPPLLAQECVGTGWCWDFPLPHGNALTGVWALAPDDVWTVSQFGMISHRGPSGVTAVNSPTTADLNAIWGSG